MMLIRQKKQRPRGQPTVDDGSNGKPRDIQRWENEGGAIWVFDVDQPEPEEESDRMAKAGKKAGMTSEADQLKIPWIPTDYMFACIDDARDASDAAGALRDAGFHAQDVHVLSGDDVLKLIEAQCEQCDIVTRTIRFLWKYMTEEGLTFLDYAEEAKGGHTLIAVHIVKKDGAEEARQILAKHRAHRIEYWGHHGSQTLLPTG